MIKRLTILMMLMAICSPFLLSCDDEKSGAPCMDQVWYRDQDGDGKGDKLYYLYSCNVQPEGFVADNTDNNDNLPCDEGIIFYRDNDNDGLGDPNVSIEACEAPEGYVDNNNDDNDND